MRRKAVINALLAIVVATIAGCATMESAGHKYMMKGQVLDVYDGSSYLCIGSKDGAEVGQEYAVYRFVKTVNPNPKYAGQPYFMREKVGKIKITEIVDEHMAKATKISGEVKENYWAELD